MHLENNTVVVKFLNIHKNNNGKIILNYQKPIKNSNYYWYIDKEQQKQIKVGDIIINQRGFKSQPHLAVVIDVQSHLNGVFHKPIGQITNQNIKNYLTKHVNDHKFNQFAYQRYLEIIDLQNKVKNKNH